MQEQDVGPLAHRQRREPQPPDRHVVHAQQRRAAVREPEQALEAEREVQLAARVQAALGERLDARQLALAQLQPGGGVGADRDVRPPARRARAHAGAVRGAADLPRVPDVAQAHVVRGVEARLRAEIAAREGAEGLLDLLRERRHGRHATRQRRGMRRLDPLMWPCVRQIRLYDTRTRSVRPLEPRDPGRVGIYACGPTVYARVHVGNARPFVVFSQLKRFLEHEGYDVTFVGQHHGHQRQDLRRRARPRGATRPTWRARWPPPTSRTPGGSASGGPTTSRWRRRRSGRSSS